MGTKVVCFTHNDTGAKEWTDECSTPEEFQEKFPNCFTTYIFDSPYNSVDN